ncbi:MAG: helix-turn-helix transcriptional regulator [Planctomycetales bacterium]|nr:helix-turn-helix transcriptional regulator [Planctomycetales bacterium]
MARTTDGNRILRHKLGGNQAELSDRIAAEKLNVYVARMIHDARMEAGLTQQALADLVGTKQQVIARLEDADYEGHSLSMLQRIAGALGRGLSVAFVEKHA